MQMDSISIRYGEFVSMEFDANDITAVSATIYVGHPGEAPKITKTIALTAGTGTFELDSSDTSIPLAKGENAYKYQVNIENENGQPQMYPEPVDDCDDCDDNFPTFSVHESLGATEVVS